MMQAPALDILAPGLSDRPWSEAEALGGAVWLWMHSNFHRDMPLHTLQVLLLPAIKNRQFVLASEGGRPVFYLSWAMLSAAAETRYLKQSPLLMPEADWNCGDRTWILDWVAPFGHTAAMTHYLQRRLFADRVVRTLYHHGRERGMKIKTFRGIAVLPAEARLWQELHPIQRED